MSEIFNGLKASPRLRVTMIKGAGPNSTVEWAAPCLPRTGRLAKTLGSIIGRDAYTIEQLSSFPFVANYIRRMRPDIVFYHDASLGFQLFRWRRQIGVPFRLVFANGGPCRPPFDRTDFVLHAAPYYRDVAVGAGESPQRHFMIPQGITLRDPPSHDPLARRNLREKLQIPLECPVILSVGWISREHKRMHYIVEEVARMPHPRPFLQMLGAMDESSSEIRALATNQLGLEGYSMRSVAYNQVADYYCASDLFVLGSLQEGFGRVYIEALMHGLPTIAHQHPVMEYVLGGRGILRDLTRTGELTQAIGTVLSQINGPEEILQRWRYVRDQFSWQSLSPQYIDMFETIAGSKPLQNII